MRIIPVVALLLLSACVPAVDPELPTLHEVSLYGLGHDFRYSYFFGAPGLVTVGGRQYELRQDRTEGPLVVPSALAVGGAPYFREPLPPLPRNLFSVQRIPLSTDLVLRSRTETQEVIYTDGRLWFTLASSTEPGFNTRVVPRERVEGLRGIGNLNNALADMLSEELKARGPLAVAVLPRPVTPAQQVEGIGDYLRTALVVQLGLPTDLAAFAPPPRELVWGVLAQGSQAVVGGPIYRIVTDQSQLLGLWNQAHGAQLTLPPLPEVDFRRESVVAIFIGQRPTGGYGLSVTELLLENNEVYLEVRLTQPSPGAMVTQALTSPWLMVRIQRPGVPVAWFRNADTGELFAVARRDF